MPTHEDSIDLAIRLARAIAREYAVHPIRVRIDISEDPQGFCYPITPAALFGPPYVHQREQRQPTAATAAPAAPRQADVEETGSPMSPIPAAILEALEEADKPLTVTLLLMQLDKAGKRFNRQAFSKHLEEMLEDGTIEHPEDRPKFYQLPTEGGEAKSPGGVRPAK